MILPKDSAGPASGAGGIPSNYSRLIARELGLQVRDLPELLQGTGLTTTQFLDEDQTLSAEQQVQILRQALVLSGDPGFGLRLGRRLNPSTHGAMGVLANSSANLLRALEAICLYVPTRMSLIRLELINEQETLSCRCHFELELEADLRRCIAETLVTNFFDFAEFIVGRPLHEARVFLPHAEPAYSARYAENIPGEVEFSAAHFCLSFPRAVGEIPNASANRHSYHLALSQCEAMLAQLPGDRDSYAYKVQKLLLSRPLGVLTEAEAAAALFMTKRTLARRLQAEGTGFRAIRDALLSRQASSYLRDQDLSVDAIASLLGYHDAANFRRAFKRWFGQPPDQYRRQWRH